MSKYEKNLKEAIDAYSEGLAKASANNDKNLASFFTTGLNRLIRQLEYAQRYKTMWLQNTPVVLDLKEIRNKQCQGI